MPPTIITYLRYSELMQRPVPTTGEFREKLAQFSVPSVMYVCSVLNGMLHGWEGRKDDEAHANLVRNAFPATTANYILECCQSKDDPRSVFHRRQLLFVCKQALEVCMETGVNAASQHHWGGLGYVLLMANDLLRSQVSVCASIQSQQMKLISEFIPLTEASGFYRPLNKIIRSYLLFNRFFQGPGKLEAAAAFEKTSGMSFSKYQALCLAIFTKYIRANLGAYRANPTDFPLKKSWFRQMTLPEHYVPAFLDDVSASQEQYKDLFRRRDHGTNDFTCFRNKPFFRYGESLLPVDIGFVAEKFETGPFWAVNHALEGKRRLQFHSAWGMAFETYINWLVSESSASEKNRVYLDPRFSNGDQVCDAIIICGDSAVFIETKGSTFTAEAKYGMNIDCLESEIEEKLVQTTDGERKGVAQLAYACENTFGRQNRRDVVGVDLSRVTKIFPLLISRDDIGGAMLLNAHLAARFKEILRRKSLRGVTVTPIFSLSAQDFEAISSYLRDASLSEILEERYRNDPNLMSTFWAVPNGIIDKMGERELSVLKAPYKELFAMIQIEVFPHGERALDQAYRQIPETPNRSAEPS